MGGKSDLLNFFAAVLGNCLTGLCPSHCLQMGQLLITVINSAWSCILHIRTIESFICAQSVKVNVSMCDLMIDPASNSDSLWGADLISSSIAIGHIRVQALSMYTSQCVIFCFLREFVFLRKLSQVGPKAALEQSGPTTARNSEIFLSPKGIRLAQHATGEGGL